MNNQKGEEINRVAIHEHFFSSCLVLDTIFLSFLSLVFLTVLQVVRSSTSVLLIMMRPSQRKM